MKKLFNEKYVENCVEWRIQVTVSITDAWISTYLFTRMLHNRRRQQQ